MEATAPATDGSRAIDAWEVCAWAALVIWVAVRWPLVEPEALISGGTLSAAAPGGLAGPLPHAAAVFAVILGAIAPGAWLMDRLDPPDAQPLEALVLSCVLGLAAISTSLSTLALFGMLRPGAITGTVGALCLAPLILARARARAGVAWRALRGLPGRVRALALRSRGAHRLVLAALLVMAAVSLVKAMAPPWYPDALYYHLALPRLYLDAGGFVPVPQDPLGGTQPGFSQMLFAIPLAFGMDGVAALLGWAYLPVTLLATALLARRMAGREAALGAVAVLMVTPHLAWVAGAPVADLPFTAHVTVALLAAVRSRSDDTGGWRTVAALVAGLALATKYQGLVPMALIWLALAVPVRWSVASALSVLRMTLLMGLPFLPWAVRGALQWGSPLFPIHLPASTDPALRELLALFRADWATHGHGSGLAWLPFDLTFLSRIDDLAGYEGEIGPIWLALLPLAFLAQLNRTRAAVGVFALVQLAAWTVGAREIRYLFPALPALAIFMAAPFADRRMAARAWRLVAGGALVCAAWLVGQARPAYDLPYLIGRESADSYYRTLAATSDLYRACESLRSARAGSRALFFWDDRGYFCPVPYLPDHLVPMSSNAVLHRLPAQPEALLARLRCLRVTHLVINRRAWKEAGARKVAWPFGETLARLLARPELRRFGPERCDVEVWEIDGAAR